MFENRKLAVINNRLSNENPTIPQSSSPTNLPLVPVEILSSAKVGNVYEYTWKAVKQDGTIDSSVGQSGTNTKALAQCEIGKTMTSPTYNVGDVVMLSRGAKTYYLVGGGGGSTNGLETPLLDLTEIYISDVLSLLGWEHGKKTDNGTQTGNETAFKIKVLVGQKYDYTQDKNIEVYRILHFNSAGIMFKAEKPTEQDGFETTQFPDA